MASGPLLIHKGKIPVFPVESNHEFYVDRHPRSAIGVGKGKHIVMVTVDGRQPGHAGGASIKEMAYLMKQLGCGDAINLDGGGSTTLWSHKAPGKGVLNSPSTNKRFDHEGERPNASILMIKHK